MISVGQACRWLRPGGVRGLPDVFAPLGSSSRQQGQINIYKTNIIIVITIMMKRTKLDNLLVLMARGCSQVIHMQTMAGIETRRSIDRSIDQLMGPADNSIYRKEH